MLPLWHKSSHRRYVNERMWLCSNKTLFMKASSRLDLAHGFISLSTPPLNYLQEHHLHLAKLSSHLLPLFYVKSGKAMNDHSRETSSTTHKFNPGWSRGHFKSASWWLWGLRHTGYMSLLRSKFINTVLDLESLALKFHVSQNIQYGVFLKLFLRKGGAALYFSP